MLKIKDFMKLWRPASVPATASAGLLFEYNGRLYVDDGTIVYPVARSIDVQAFTVAGTGTFTVPSRAVLIKVQMWGGGGGGGGGAGGTTAVFASGGLGGVPGAYSEGQFEASLLGSTVTYTVGAAGTGGTGSTTTGNNGVTGGGTIFDNTNYLLSAGGGKLGRGGVTNTASRKLPDIQDVAPVGNIYGVPTPYHNMLTPEPTDSEPKNTTTQSAYNFRGHMAYMMMPGRGGYGAGMKASGTVNDYAAIAGEHWNFPGGQSGGALGTSTTGGAGGDAPAVPSFSRVGGGPGGGGTHLSGTGGAGGSGATGGPGTPGGGGGAGSTAGGAGGAAAPGAIIITTYF